MILYQVFYNNIRALDTFRFIRYHGNMKINDARAKAYKSSAIPLKGDERALGMGKNDMPSAEGKDPVKMARLISAFARHSSGKKASSVYSGNNERKTKERVFAMGKETQTMEGKDKGQGFVASEELLRRTEALKNQGLLKVAAGTGGEDGAPDSVWRRVAKFLLVIGVDEAAKVMQHLTDEQTQRIIPEIASIRSISEDEANDVLKEFSALMKTARERGGVDTAREILAKAYGEDKADKMLDAAVPWREGKPFEYLNDTSDQHIKVLLEDEGAAVQAIVLSRIDPKKAAAVISLMDADERRAAISRLAHIDQVLPDTLRRIDEQLHKKLLSLSAQMAETVDGRASLAEILKRMTPEAEDDLLDTIGYDDPDLADDLRSRLFTLGDVVDADDRFLQRQLHEMDDSSIALLIADKDEAFRDKIFSCLSKGRGSTVREEEQLMKPMRKRDCDEATSRFVTELRRAYEKGDLKILNRDDEEYVE